MGIVVILPGCQSNNIGRTGQLQPFNFVYAGNTYIATGVTVASAETSANTPSNVAYVGSVSYEGTNYDVYIIQGVDENEAIAIKILMVGGYWYSKYERLYGQTEPADFVYQGRAYRGTGKTVAIEKVDVNAEKSNAVNYLSSVVYQGTTYDVYSIQNLDEKQAIAVKIVKAGKTVGFYNYYFKYERQ